MWRPSTPSRTPRFFAGFLETLGEYRRRGGKIAVISHSDPEVIRAHYRAAGPLDPDLVFGWEDEEEKRTPPPGPGRRVRAGLGLPASRALILDDLKPGVLMAREAGVAVAAAGWAHNIGTIREYMQSNCLAY